MTTEKYSGRKLRAGAGGGANHQSPGIGRRAVKGQGENTETLPLVRGANGRAGRQNRSSFISRSDLTLKLAHTAGR